MKAGAMADEHYDAIVIGTSQGGRFLPLELAKAGQKVALVERDQLGGVCANTQRCARRRPRRGFAHRR
jgi:choline dehydrogenase-like flavoprotein